MWYVFIWYRRFSTALESILRKEYPHLKIYCIVSLYLTAHDCWLSHNFKQPWSCKLSFSCHGLRSLNTLIRVFYFVGELICFVLIMSTAWQVWNFRRKKDKEFAQSLCSHLNTSAGSWRALTFSLILPVLWSVPKCCLLSVSRISMVLITFLRNKQTNNITNRSLVCSYF